jgi:hypothetical protein
MLNRLRRRTFALGLSQARLLAYLLVRGWKLVSVRPFFLRDANKSPEGLRLRFSEEDEISELTEGTSY